MGGACVEERPDPVVGKVPESERRSLDPFDQVVDGFGRAVGYPRAVPRSGLLRPALQRSAELADLRRGLVLKVGCEEGDSREGSIPWGG